MWPILGLRRCRGYRCPMRGMQNTYHKLPGYLKNLPRGLTNRAAKPPKHRALFEIPSSALTWRSERYLWWLPMEADAPEEGVLVPGV